MKRLRIDLETLPEEGKVFSGELDGEIFGIDDDEVHSIGNLNFNLTARRFEGELFLQGKISAPFEFRCVRCLEYFPMTLSLNDFATSIEIDNQNIVDISDALREEIILEFPAYPHCEDSDTSKACVMKNEHFGVDKQGETGVNTSAPNGERGVWDALDALGDQ